MNTERIFKILFLLERYDRELGVSVTVENSVVFCEHQNLNQSEQSTRISMFRELFEHASNVIGKHSVSTFQMYVWFDFSSFQQRFGVKNMSD